MKQLAPRVARRRVWMGALVVSAILVSAPDLGAQVFGGGPSFPNVSITGTKKKWQFVTFNFDTSINTSETGSSPHPFLDFRLNLRMTHVGSGEITHIPGFYAADGDAADTSADSGDKWRAMWTPNRTGAWEWRVTHFVTGTNCAIDPGASTTVADASIDGAYGFLNIGAIPSGAEGFFAKGALRYVSKHYLQFAETGEYYLRNGIGSPENFLAYYEFDNTPGSTPCSSSPFVFDYSTHFNDWDSGDTADAAHIWASTKGENILGAINYVSGEGVNNVYMVVNSVGADSDNVFPWRTSSDLTRYDVSKLAQWNQVFTHMSTRGVMLELVLEENENHSLLDDGGTILSNERKLYYRELVARFAHHHAIQWVIGEEAPYCADDLEDIAEYIRSIDPYDHPISHHTFFPCNPVNALDICSELDLVDGTMCVPPGDETPPIDDQYAPHYANPYLEAASLQTGPLVLRRDTEDVHDSSTGVRKWAIFGDEAAATPLDDPAKIVTNRKGLWGNLVGGGSGVSWYAAYENCEAPDMNDDDNTISDLRLEDFRLIDDYWQFTKIALDFFDAHVPDISLLSPNEALDSSGVSQDGVLADVGDLYVVYRSVASATNLTVTSGTYDVYWFNPRTGGSLQTGTVTTLNGPGSPSLGQPPSDTSLDWVALVVKQ